MDTLNKAITRLSRERAMLRNALKRLTRWADEVDCMMDGDDDKYESWQRELDALYKAVDHAKSVIERTEPKHQ